MVFHTVGFIFILYLMSLLCPNFNLDPSNNPIVGLLTSIISTLFIIPLFGINYVITKMFIIKFNNKLYIAINVILIILSVLWITSFYTVSLFNDSSTRTPMIYIFIICYIAYIFIISVAFSQSYSTKLSGGVSDLYSFITSSTTPPVPIPYTIDPNASPSIHGSTTGSTPVGLSAISSNVEKDEYLLKYLDEINRLKDEREQLKQLLDLKPGTIYTSGHNETYNYLLNYMNEITTLITEKEELKQLLDNLFKSGYSNDEMNNYLLKYIDEISQLNDEKELLKQLLSNISNNSDTSEKTQDLKNKLLKLMMNKIKSNKNIETFKDKLKQKDILLKKTVNNILKKMNSNENISSLASKTGKKEYGKILQELKNLKTKLNSITVS
jgi:hypothetical protein